MPAAGLDLQSELAALRRRIAMQFPERPVPAREALTRGNTAALRDVEGARRIEERLAGRAWSTVAPAEAKECWASFCYLSDSAYRYYLPALLDAALASLGADDRLVHSMLYQLQPGYGSIYWDGADTRFDERAAALTPGQYAAVVDLLGFFFRRSTMGPLAAMALRFGWNRHPDMPAYREAMDWYERETHWTCPPPTEDVRALVTQIEQAFAATEPPPLAALCASRQGDEPGEVCLDMAGLDWRQISPGHLDRNSTCLSFMTPVGVCYYLPAYLRAELMGLLQTDGALFHLQYDPARFDSLNGAQRAAVAGYMRFVRDRDREWNPGQVEEIDAALGGIWGSDKA